MKRSYHSNLAFVDILFNTLLCFVVFFTLALIHMNKESAEESAGIEFEAFVMIIATWPAEFGDRDDLGRRGELLGNENERLFNNREIVTIRRKFPGEFIVNAHAYSKISYGPIPVNVKVIRVRKNKIISDEVLIFDYTGQERTACRFTVSHNGNIENINRLSKSIAREIVRGY